MFYISKEFTFDAAHYLPLYKGKCENLHGHTYRICVTVKNKELTEGMAFDFAKLKRIMKEEVFDLWDHQLINDTVENPSAENMCQYVWERFSQHKEIGDKLYEVKIWETPTSCATLRKE